MNKIEPDLKTVTFSTMSGDSIVAYQTSPRGGTLYCTKDGDRVKLSGKAALYSEADINIG